MIRLWFKDGTYMDVPENTLEYWEMDPALDRVEYPDANDHFEEEYRLAENGK